MRGLLGHRVGGRLGVVRLPTTTAGWSSPPRGKARSAGETCAPPRAYPVGKYRDRRAADGAICPGRRAGLFRALHAACAPPGGSLAPDCRARQRATFSRRRSSPSSAPGAGTRRGAPFRPWLYTVAINAARDHLRRNRREEPTETLPEEPAEPVPLPDPGLTRTVEAALAQLPENQREAIVLHRFEGFSFKEIAEAARRDRDRGEGSRPPGLRAAARAARLAEGGRMTDCDRFLEALASDRLDDAARAHARGVRRLRSAASPGRLRRATRLPRRWRRCTAGRSRRSGRRRCARGRGTRQGSPCSRVRWPSSCR